MNDELTDHLTALRLPHLEVEDCWYSCPASGKCCNENVPDDACTCGADARNARLALVVAAVERLRAEVERLRSYDHAAHFPTVAVPLAGVTIAGPIMEPTLLVPAEVPS